MIAVAENQAVNDRTTAIDRSARTRQRDASATGCKEPDALVGDVAGIVASGSPERNRVHRGRATHAYIARLIAYGCLNLADRLILPDFLDFNPTSDFLVHADRFDEFPLDGKKNRSRARQVFGDQGIENAGRDTALHDQFAEDRSFREFLVVVQRIAIARHFRETDNVLHAGAARPLRKVTNLGAAFDHT
jgi:hypothetical protein